MSLPIYQHPSLTVLIDDSDSFLKSLSFQLDPALASKSFHDTRSAIDWLGQQDGEGQYSDALHASYDTYPNAHEQCNVAFDIDQIHRISFHRQRFATPSVLVVDYSMPQMNGVQVCEALRHLPCKKILFTGVADEKVAVDAFNRGLIDRYIKKSDEAALDKLEAEIVALQREFFVARSDSLRDMLALHNYAFVSDPAFAAVVRALLREHGIVEHYVYSNPPGILMYDHEGNAQLLVVETEASMDSHFEVACDNDAPDSLLTALRERCIVAWFRGGDGLYAKSFASSWHKHVQPARLCRGSQNFYWALFPLAPGELTEPAASFADFLRTRELA
ncbi:response regulator [Massilia sp. CF038]|uniref:response regulator n=1 Tax=Massilia sp. CF038 TaxID=1881045 RepID=UPI00092151AF|nr:response regulator [Massilia sp. CF038]SHG43437.1 Response regulator receiver domain-containing protein [Massilia sp. CF038]